MLVSDILKDKGDRVVSIGAHESARAAIALMVQNRIGAVLAKQPDGGIAGILSERDVVAAMHAHGEQTFTKPVGELMTKDVVTCAPDDPVAGVMAMMTAQRFRHMPVVAGDRLVGMISIGDVVKNRIEEAQAEVDALRQYIAL